MDFIIKDSNKIKNVLLTGKYIDILDQDVCDLVASDNFTMDNDSIKLMINNVMHKNNLFKYNNKLLHLFH